jgi:hypothetical protein
MAKSKLRLPWAIVGRSAPGDFFENVVVIPLGPRAMEGWRAILKINDHALGPTQVHLEAQGKAWMLNHRKAKLPQRHRVTEANQ